MVNGAEEIEDVTAKGCPAAPDGERGHPRITAEGIDLLAGAG